jgi:alpha-amylase
VHPPGDARRLVGGALLALVLGGCAGGGAAPARRGAAVEPPGPATVTPQRDWRDAILYFVLVDRFADGDPSNNRGVERGAKGAFHGGDLAGLRSQLDEIASLGVTALWISPVVRNIDGFVTGAGFPDWAYHGYWADEFTAIDPRFGSEAELAALVEAAHQRGLAVLLDVVYNHVGYGARWLADPARRHWLRSPERGECGSDDLTTCLAGLPDLRTERPEVAAHLMGAHLSLAERVALDGFRLDTVKHVTHEFWREHRLRTRTELGEDFFLLGEVWGGDAASLDPWFAGDEMDAGFDFSFQGSVVAWLRGRGRTVAFDRYLQSRERVRDGHLLAHFLSSHDVPGALHLLDGDRDAFLLAAALQLTVSGIPTIYYGEEVARRIGEWPENRSDMPWGGRAIPPGAGIARDEELRGAYRRLIATRRRHRALQAGAHQTLHADGDLLVFARAAEGDAVVVAVNRGAGPATAAVPAPAQWRGGAARDALTGARFETAAGRLALVVPGRTALVLEAEAAAGPATGGQTWRK